MLDHAPEEEDAGDVGHVDRAEVAADLPVVDHGQGAEHELVEDPTQEEHAAHVVVLQARQHTDASIDV